MLALWRVRGSCLHHSSPALEPQHLLALTPALANSFRLREAAAAMAGGGDAGDDGGDPPHACGGEGPAG